MKRNLIFLLKVRYVFITLVFFSCQSSDEVENILVEGDESTLRIIDSNNLTITSVDGNEKLILEAIREDDATYTILNKSTKSSYSSENFEINYETEDSKLSITIDADGIFLISFPSTLNTKSRGGCDCVYIDNEETICTGIAVECDPHGILYEDEDNCYLSLKHEYNGEVIGLSGKYMRVCGLPQETIDCLMKEPTGTGYSCG